MSKKIVSRILLLLLFTCILTVAFDIRVVETESAGTKSMKYPRDKALDVGQTGGAVEDYIWMASFGPDNLGNNGLPGRYVGTDTPYNGFGVPNWTGNFSLTESFASVSSITVHAFPFTGDEYTYNLTEGVDYLVHAEDDLIELITSVDVPVIYEHWVDGVNNSLNGWPWIRYVSSGISSVYVDMHNGTVRFSPNAGYTGDYTQGEWWFDPDWTWELEGWWALGYYCPASYCWPAGSGWWLNYTAASYLTVDYEVRPEKEWISFAPETAPGTPSDVSLKCSDNTGICIDSDVPGMYSVNVSVEGETYQSLSIPYAGHTVEIGKPEVPVIRRYLEIPHNVNLTAEIIYSDFTIFGGYYVYPAQEPRPDMHTNDTWEFIIDNVTYSTNEFYPTYSVVVDEPVIVRGHRIVPLTLYPVQFNPITKQLRGYSKIEVRINYDRPAQIEGIEERLESEAFESLCEAFILNYKPPDRYSTRRQSDTGSPAAEYLIITHTDFTNQVEPLADWKQKKGYRTEIVTTATTGSTAGEIETYIQTAYDTWDPPPTYILLVGDAEFIPTHYQTVHPFHGFMTATDLYYATVDGTDYFPDIFIGRLSVDTAAETTTVIEKILDYEQSPPVDPDFYSDISVCAFFQDRDDNGFEDRRFVLTSEEIRDYLLTQNYDVERIYCTPDQVTPTNYNLGTFANGEPLPDELLKPGFAWNGDASDITAAINSGRFIINHRDHGDSRNYEWGGIEGWGDPQYTTADISGLANGDRTPVVFSINCMTGWFDGETDPNVGNNHESFCEAFLRRQNGGAVAVIGSTRVSYSGYNDDLCRGFYDAIWPDFDPSIQTGALYKLGQILTYGKIYMFLHPHGVRTQIEFEEFHLFGDPEMSIWTRQPQPLTVTHPSAIGSGGSQKFVVRVTDGMDPVLHALVCLQKDADVYMIEYTDAGGYAAFDITPGTGGNLDVTVTKHDYLPYEGNIVVTDNGAIIAVSPDTGPPGISFTVTGSAFDDGETVDIALGGTSIGSVSASAGGFSQSFTVPSVPQGAANVVAVGQSSGRVAVAVFNVLAPLPPPDPYTYCPWDSSTWHLNPSGVNPTWNNPEIQLYEESSGVPASSGNLLLGTTYRVETTIHNFAIVPASDTQVTFTWSRMGVGMTANWQLIDTVIVDVPGSPGTVPVSVLWTPITEGHTCVNVQIYHSLDSNTDNNRAMENTQVHPIASPAEILFEVHNPTNTTALVYIDVVQSGGEELWETRIERTYPQILEPGQNQTVTLLVDAPEWAEVGESRVLTVTGIINGEPIGGIDFEVVKMLPFDIAVENVTRSKTVIGKGYNTSINVTIENRGLFNVTFNVIVVHEGLSIPSPTQTDTFWSFGDVNRDGYIDEVDINLIVAAYDSTPGDPNWNPDCDLNQDLKVDIFDMIICAGYFGNDVWTWFGLSPSPIGKETVTLTSGNSMTLNFVWNTTGVNYGNYTLNATATCVPGEVNCADNRGSSWVVVTILGDVDGDFDVDLFDAVKLLLCYGSEVGDPCYDEDPNCDIDGDGDIDLFDAVRLLIHYGDEYP